MPRLQEVASWVSAASGIVALILAALLYTPSVAQAAEGGAGIPNDCILTKVMDGNRILSCSVRGDCRPPRGPYPCEMILEYDLEDNLLNCSVRPCENR